MRPRFGALTQALAVIFILAGLGAAYAGLNSGHQTAPGHGNDQAILFALAVGYLVVGVSLWMQYLWAWWAGLILTTVVVVMDAVLKAPDRGWMIWSGFLVAFAMSAIQGWRDESRTRRNKPAGR
jgi:hypothetical protein